MGINIGSKELVDAKLGSKQISEIYLGDKLIWPTFVSGLYPVVEAIYKIHGIQPVLYLPLNGNTRAYLSKVTLDPTINATFLASSNFTQDRLEDTDDFGGKKYGKSWLRSRSDLNRIRIMKTQLGLKIDGLTLFEIIKPSSPYPTRIDFLSDGTNLQWFSLDSNDKQTFFPVYKTNEFLMSKVEGESYIGAGFHVWMARAGAKQIGNNNNYIAAVDQDSSFWSQSTATVSPYNGIYIGATYLDILPSITGSAANDVVQDLLLYDQALPNYFLNAIGMHTHYVRSNGFEYIAPMALCCYYASGHMPNDSTMALTSLAYNANRFTITSNIVINGYNDRSNVIESLLNFPTLGNPNITKFTQFDMDTSPYSSDFINILNGMDIGSLSFEGTGMDANDVMSVYLVGYTELNKNLEDQDYCVLGKFLGACLYTGFEPNSLKKYAGKILWVSPVLLTNTDTPFVFPNGIIDLQRNNGSVLTAIDRTATKPLICSLFNGTSTTLDKSYCSNGWAGIFYGKTIPDVNNAFLNFEKGFESYKLAWNPSLRTNSASSLPTCYYVGIESTVYNNITDAFSLSICFKITNNSDYYSLMGCITKYARRYYGISIGTYDGSNTIDIVVDFDNKSIVLSTITPEIGKWYNLVVRATVIKSGGKITRYSIYARINDQDFSQQFSLNATSISYSNLPVLTPRGVLPVGGALNGNTITPFMGVIQDFFIWNRTLSYTEFDNIANYYKNKGIV